MKIILLLSLLLLTQLVSGQKKKIVLYDTLGNPTTYESYGAQLFTGRYKSVYDKKENKKTLQRSTKAEFQKEIGKTRKRISISAHLGTPFPEFTLIDINGKEWSKESLKGKIVAINFWFIGCAPCEVERPLLNLLAERYKMNTEVVFISFANNTKSQLDIFLTNHDFDYTVLPTEKNFIKDNMSINSYPVNIILDRKGSYFYNSVGSGIGIMHILSQEIEKALKF